MDESYPSDAASGTASAGSALHADVMITRRQLMELSAATLLNSLVHVRVVRAEEWSSPLVIVLTDIGLESGQRLVHDILDIFEAQQIPLVIAVNVEPAKKHNLPQGYLALVRRLASSDRHQFEIGLQAQSLNKKSTYTRMRIVSEAQSEFMRLMRIGSSRCCENCVSAQTLVAEGLEVGSGAASIVRVAGFRTLINFDANTANAKIGEYNITENGVAHFVGSIDTLHPSGNGALREMDGVREELVRQATARRPIALRLSADSLIKMGGDTATTYIRQLTTLIDNYVREKQVRYLTATVLYEQTYKGPLSFRVIANTVNEIRFGRETGLGSTDPLLVPRASSTLANEKAMPINDEFSRKAVAEAYDALKFVLTGSDTHAGVDRFGRFHIRSGIECNMNWNEKADSAEDYLVRVPAPKIGSALRSQFSPKSVVAFERTGRNKFVNSSEYYRKVVGAVPLLEYLQHARVATALQRSAVPLAEKEKAAYLADARTAWRYFERFAKDYGNLAPATARTENNGSYPYPIITMWDLGSLILATVSAHRLSIVDDDRLAQIAQAAVRFLKQAIFVTGESQLPAVNWSITGGPGDYTGFDSVDVGRLLIALKIMDIHTSGDLKLSKILETWNLKAALAGRQVHDHNGIEWVLKHRHLYSIYASRGYQLWGFQLERLFDDDNPAENMDRAVAFVEAAASRGGFATEPFLTEEVELGASEHSQLIADVVFSAQIKRFITTGILTAVSEAPIDAQPWFTYQGYQLDNDQEDWPVHAPVGHRDADTSEFEKFNRLLNSKASFLWAAARPHNYTRMLVHKIREKATTSIGFASGVREWNGRRTKTADLNTNALILESIAYLFAGRRRLIEKV